MRYFLPLLLILMLLTVVLPAGAQNAYFFERLEIEIWPEFDRPDVLVILRASLSSTSSLPARLTMRIPKSAGSPFALAMKEMDGTLYTLPFETEISGDWILVSFTTPSPAIQLEFYDPDLQVAGDQRSYTYLWQTDYAAETVQVRVQQPLGATDMRITPDLGSGAQAADGYTYYTASLGAVNARSTIRLSIAYVRPENARRTTGIPVQPVTPLDEPIPGRMDIQELWPWGLVALGVLLLAGGIFWYVQSERKNKKKGHKHHSQGSKDKDVSEDARTAPEKASASARRITGPLEQPHVYCHRCGKRAQRGDVFCRTCGTKLRFE